MDPAGRGCTVHLTADGNRVAVVQNPTLRWPETSPRPISSLTAWTVPPSWSATLTAAPSSPKRATTPDVAALVYITAFAPDKGESVNSLIADPPPGAPVPPILPPKDGFLFLDRDKFAASFAADVPAAQAAFMADSQVPWGVDALGGAVSEPAWRTKPSWYLVATDDRMIPPPAQRAMSERAGSTVTETPGSHAIYVSNPAAVAAVIAQAAATLTHQS